MGKSIRIYLSDGSVSGIRHAEIVNWTGQAIACPRSRFAELKEWPEAKRPGIYFLFGQNEDTGEDAVYIGEAEVVIDRLYSHISGKSFWNEVVVFTNKDDNLTKGHVRYLESRLVDLSNFAKRYKIENSASPQLPALPRADRDAMEEFIDGARTLLGVLGHRVLEPLIARPIASNNPDISNPIPVKTEPFTGIYELAKQPLEQAFKLRISNLLASAVRTDEGLVVIANSEAALTIQNSLSMGYRTLRESLISSGILIENGLKLKFTQDYLFRSPSQAAAIIVGYAINGRDAWRTNDGLTFSEFEDQLSKIL